MKEYEHTDVGDKALMKRICEDRGIKLTFLGKDEGKGGYNYAASTFEDIMIAPFVKCEAGDVIDGYKMEHACHNPLECRLIAFFHELAHATAPSHLIPQLASNFSWNFTSKFQFELWTTMAGISIAQIHHDTKFSDEAVKWMLEESMSYMRDSAEDMALVSKVHEDGSYTLQYNDWCEIEAGKRADRTRDEVLEFIARRFPKDCNWNDGNCYYFARILKARFPYGLISYDTIDGHFVFEIAGRRFDWGGEVVDDGKKHHYVSWDEFEDYDKDRYDRIVRGCIK